MKIRLPATSRLFEDDFVFGVATSSFQIEGAADVRLPSIWDTFCATPGKIRDNSDGRVTCDHVNRWRDDVELISWLGVDAYRLSISWPRVIKKDGEVNEVGLRFYINLLDALKQHGIKAFVTLYHWDLPQHIEDSGGWLNRDTVNLYCDYVDKISRAFGDRVYSYATLNEPYCSAHLGYEKGVHAPGHTEKGYGKQAAHNLLLAHGKAMEILQNNSPQSLNGIVLNFTPCYPATDSEADRKAAVLADEEINQWYLMPLLEGRYPGLMQQLPQSERPDIHDGDLATIAAPLDFLGVNYYTRSVVRADGETGFVEVEPTLPLTDMGWEVFPQGLTDILVSLHTRYRLPPVYVAENGAAIADAPDDDEIHDEERVEYMQQHLQAVTEAIRQGVNVSGFFYWSLMDNFEWSEGYLKRFGLVYVDYSNQRRIVKASGHAYRDFLRRRRAAIEHESVTT